MISSLSIERQAFVDPLTGGIICVVNDFHERKGAFELIGKTFKVPKEFSEFVVETFAVMTCNLFNYRFGEIEKSYINDLIFEVKQKCAPNPIISALWKMKDHKILKKFVIKLREVED